MFVSPEIVLRKSVRVLLFALWGAPILVSAQQRVADNRIFSEEIKLLQDSLQNLGTIMYNDPEEQNRLDANFKFVKTLVTALKESHSIDFPFDSLRMISVLTSPDLKFKMFSWNLPLNDGSYLYYGTIQLRTESGELKLIPLLDKTFEIADPATKPLNQNQWYGAQYYQIIPYENRHILLGWKGHSPEYSQRIIEVLEINDDQAVLGAPIFDHPDYIKHHRIIFSYASTASMYLAYQVEKNWIVFDHLSPSDPTNEGNYKFYGPDFTFDAWQFGAGKLKLLENVALENK